MIKVEIKPSVLILLYLLISNSQTNAIVDTWLDCAWSLTKIGSCVGRSWEARKVGGVAKRPLLLDCQRSWWGWKEARSWRCRSCPTAGPGPRSAAWTSADDSRRRWRSRTDPQVGSAAPSVPCKIVLALYRAHLRLLLNTAKKLNHVELKQSQSSIEFQKDYINPPPLHWATRPVLELIWSVPHR